MEDYLKSDRFKALYGAATILFTTRDVSHSFFRMQENLSKWILGGAVALIFTIVTNTQMMFDSYNIYFIKISLILALISMYQGFKNIFGHQLYNAALESKSLNNYLTKTIEQERKDEKLNELTTNEEDRETNIIVDKLVQRSIEHFLDHIKKSKHLIYQIVFLLIPLTGIILQVLFK
jgi:hypothetical protein